jgi:TRAP-type C4-dicarboxylate transport system permease small subunit
MNGRVTFKQRMDQTSEFLHKVSGVTVLLLPVIILVVVGMRAVAPQGMPLWSIDICELLMWFATYLSLGFVWRLRRHVTVEVFIEKFSPRWREWNDRAMVTILLIMSLIMMAGGLQVCWDSWAGDKKTTNEFPEYYFSLAIPLGLIFLVYEISVSLRKRFSGEPPVKASH